MEVKGHHTMVENVLLHKTKMNIWIQFPISENSYGQVFINTDQNVDCGQNDNNQF